MNLIRRIADRAGRFFYNVRNAYYQYPDTLKQVPGAKLIDVIEAREKDSITLMGKLSRALNDKQITLYQWREMMAVEIRRGTSQAFAVGRGGWQQVTTADRALISERLKQEFKFLDKFGRDIAEGKVSEAQIANRAAMYAKHYESAYWAGETEAHRAAGMTYERRVLGVAHHCSDCPDLADHWEEIGTLPPPGEGCECLSNCKCSMEYR